MKQFIRPGMVFIDVGAFVGFYSILAASLGARVIALEPDPRNFRILLFNIELNGKEMKERILAINAAVGANEGFLTIKLADSLAETSATNYLGNDRVVGVIKVPLLSLDTLVRSQGLQRVDAIKIDVEGAGYDVVKGASSIIRKFRPHIILEVHGWVHGNEFRVFKLLNEKFNYSYKILEFRDQRNFILYLKPRMGFTSDSSLMNKETFSINCP
ncbi:FkbM family methyltransferase [Candidatus Bathyarchaeota archaeon]|nr:FkbM family methyltransferase [Candidatus Bathyarchaeota archaeon]